MIDCTQEATWNKLYVLHQNIFDKLCVRGNKKKYKIKQQKNTQIMDSGIAVCNFVPLLFLSTPIYWKHP